jgi:hypothetical protein
MRILLYIFALLAFSGQLLAQPSDALDPDYVVLQPYETFKGVQANQGAGAVINNVGIMVPGEKFGSVFLNAIDTIGYNDVWLEHKRPLGLFQGGADFSLFNRAKFTFENCFYVRKIFSRGKNYLPLLIADKGGNFRVRYPLAPYSYKTDDSIPYLSNPNGYAFGVYNGLGCAYFNSDSLEDLLAINGLDTSSTISIWYGDDLEFNGDTVTIGGQFRNFVPFKQSIIIAGCYVKSSNVDVLDVNRDNIPDILFLADSTGEGSQRGKRRVNVVLGKLTDTNEWVVNKSIALIPPFEVLYFKTMDFLRSDGIPDLIIQSPDTIYCFDGSSIDFLETEPNWSHPTLAIPSPSILDNKRFPNNGKSIFEWYYLFDAGNVNGSGEHSLATFAGTITDTSSLGGVTYCFIYSGGKAADEKADAMVIYDDGIYSAYNAFDTIQASLSGTTNFLLGDPSNTAGGTGRLDYFNGSISIPHKPNPMWGITNNESSLQEFRMQTPSTVNNNFTVSIKSSGISEGILTLHDILGREICRQNIYYQGDVIRKTVLDTKSVSNGTYILLYKEQGKTLTQKIFVVH